MIEESAIVKRIADFKQLTYESQPDNLMREYSYYEPNREFTGKREDEKLKRVDDGTFIDNGYR